jgi:uncharacterized membrane protein
VLFILLETENLNLWIKTNQIMLAINALILLLIFIINFFPESFLRIVVGLPFVLFFPGFVLISALFPKKQSLSDIERVALSFGLSLAVVPLNGLVLNYLPWGINLNSILYSLTAFVVVTSTVAWIRQRGLSEEERFTVQIQFGWGRQKLSEKVLSVVVVVVTIGLLMVVGYTIAVPRSSEQYTEFYILNLDGKASDYPTNLEIGEKGGVILGVVNHERQAVKYRVETRIDDVLVGEFGPVKLENEAKCEVMVSYTPQKTGDRQKLEFLLFRDDTGESYLQLHLWIDVK